MCVPVWVHTHAHTCILFVCMFTYLCLSTCVYIYVCVIQLQLQYCTHKLDTISVCVLLEIEAPWLVIDIANHAHFIFSKSSTQAGLTPLALLTGLVLTISCMYVGHYKPYCFFLSKRTLKAHYIIVGELYYT